MIGFNSLGRLGRLGNQMFQFAALKGIAANRKYQYCLPNHTEAIDDTIGNKIKTEIFIPFKLQSLSTTNINFMDESCQIVREKYFKFDLDLFNNCPDSVSLHGYFQTQKYFQHIEDQIREDFDFYDDYKNVAQKMIAGLREPIAMHLRRTDYLINSKYHNNLDFDYYLKALSFFDSQRCILVFSDDVKWCKEQPLFRHERFVFSESGDHSIDLCLMSMCKDFIIANSTFSWWGAWLSKNVSKQVVAPKMWFGPGFKDHDTADLYPEAWLVI